MVRRILVIQPDGTDTVLDHKQLKANGLPPLKTMQKIVGGYIEMVRVLREDLAGFTFTYMVVNETGLLDDLAHNQKATEMYLANVRRQYPDHAEPWKRAKQDQRDSLRAGTVIVDITPEPDRPYRDQAPQIVGPVLWFEGYTCEELQRMGL